jgi:HSP20 family protein
MAVWDWFREEGNQIKNSIMSNETLKKWHADMDHWFDSTMQELSRLRLTSMKPELSFRPKVDVSETKKQYNITVEIPGVHPKDLRLDIENHRIIVSGEKRSSYELKEDNMHKTECSYGCFERVLSLPEDADMSTIQAEFFHGALHVTVNRLPLPSNKKNVDIKVLS